MRVAVIGAGYAGLAAAVELTAAGIPVRVFEASRTLGGRARGLVRHGVELDNGQHILVGAYSETLRLLRRVGVDPEQVLRRWPLTLLFPGHLALRAKRFPAPLHLIGALVAASGFAWPDRFAAIRFVRRLTRERFTVRPDTTVTALLAKAEQPPAVRRFLWEPLCEAALNTPPAEASAQIFANVLRDTLAGPREASDVLIPTVSLSELFPEPAARYIGKRGGDVSRAVTIDGVRGGSDGYCLAGDPSGSRYSHVIVAADPPRAMRLLADLPPMAAVVRTLAGFAYQPVVTCYLRFASSPAFPHPMMGNPLGITHWFFDRGALGGAAGLVAGVISGRGPHTAMSHRQIEAHVCGELRALTGALPDPLFAQVIEEKRATFSCVPGLERPSSRTPIPGLLLAGDYVESSYPGTLESAIRSGVACAQSLLGSWRAAGK